MKKATMLLVIFTLLFAVGTASAQNNDNVIKDQVCTLVPNPCCGELVDFCLDVMIVLDKNGDWKHVAYNGTGVGQLSGAEYTMKAVGNSHMNDLEKGAGSYHQVMIMKMEDTGDTGCSFTVHAVMHFTINPDGTITADFQHMSFDCENGTVLE